METSNNRLTHMIVAIVFTTFMGQIYWSPFDSGFRLTFAVVALGILLLIFDELPIISTVLAVGLSMFIVRTGTYLIGGQGNLFQALITYYPILFYYIAFSILFYILNMRQYFNAPLRLFLGLWVCDSIPNLIEILLREQWQTDYFEKVILAIIVIGLLRSTITVLAVILSQYYMSYTKERQLKQAYIEKITMLSSLKTELFFLKKSKNDIEDAMNRSYHIYDKLQDAMMKQELLTVTKDIHEIKKDYTRVISGIEKSIEESTKEFMSIKEIFDIVVSSHQAVAEKHQKKIKLKAIIDYDFDTTEGYVLLSVINNLVINAIESIDESGQVIIRSQLKDEKICISVKDSGCGILEEDVDYIFEPGYSTKYNKNNGVMSSGIGLTHVKHLIEKVLMGKVNLVSNAMDGTVFWIELPLTLALVDRKMTKDC